MNPDEMDKLERTAALIEAPRPDSSEPGDDTVAATPTSLAELSYRRDKPKIDLIGSTFAERYEVISLLGRGGMSVVYRARHLFTKKIVALKVLHSHLTRDETTLKRFRQEAQTSGALVHPHIISVQDFGINKDGIPYLVMDFVEGQSLADIIKSDGVLGLERFLVIMEQICSALAYAHQNQVIHRDLKPNNIMVTQAGREQAKLVDFGIAKLLEETPSQVVTQTGELCGSPLYMSPEQCGGAVLDGRSDIYALGCVMYECLTGRPPFIGQSIFETINKHQNEAPPPLVAAQIDPETLAQIESLIVRCLQKDPDERFHSASELELELRNMRLAQRGGLLARLSDVWSKPDLDRALKKKGRVSLLMGSLVTACVLSFISMWVLFFATEDFKKFEDRLDESRKVLMQNSELEFGFLRLEKFAEAYSMRRREKDLQTYEILSEKYKTSFDKVEKNLKNRPEDLAIFKNARPTFEASLDKTLALLKKLPPGREWTFADLGLVTDLRIQKEQGCQFFDKFVTEHKKSDSEVKKAQIQASRSRNLVEILSRLCLGLNAILLAVLLIYFAKGTPKRLRELSRNASRLAGLAGTSAVSKKGSGDEIADLDSVLQELAAALYESQSREKELVAKLNAQGEKLDSTVPINQKLSMDANGESCA